MFPVGRLLVFDTKTAKQFWKKRKGETVKYGFSIYWRKDVVTKGKFGNHIFDRPKV